MTLSYTCPVCQKTFDRPKRSKSRMVFCSRECYRVHTKPAERLCEQCRRPLEGAQLNQRRGFCSRECYDAMRTNKVDKVCPVCGKTFTVNGSMADRYTVCSWECRANNIRTLVCARCGNEFRSNEQRWTPKYCSEECRRPPVITSCRNCGRDFRRQPAATARQFCSFACYRSFNGENMLERDVRRILQAIGVAFIQEARMGRYSIDFLLPDLRIAFEIDGEYWHQDMRRDARKTAYVESHGWHVVRITEAEFRNAANPDVFLIERLQSATSAELAPLQPSML